jgi:hypothetical protein
MKTNAKRKSVLDAVFNVSNEKYDNNVVFRSMPTTDSRGITTFTLRTINKMGLGSLISGDGRQQPRANKEVYEDVKKEIFNIIKSKGVTVDGDVKTEMSVVRPPVHRKKRQKIMLWKVLNQMNNI